MTHTVKAVYSGGMLRVMGPLPLAEGTIVDVAVTPATPVTPFPPLTPEQVHALRRMDAATTLEEKRRVAVETDHLFPEPDGYDLQKAIEENRKVPWFRPLNLGWDEDADRP